MSEAPEEERRSLLAKFRYASLFQGLLIVLVALVAFGPTLGALARQAEARRRAASREVIESGVNSMARFAETAGEITGIFVAAGTGQLISVVKSDAHNRRVLFRLGAFLCFFK